MPDTVSQAAESLKFKRANAHYRRRGGVVAVIERLKARGMNDLAISELLSEETGEQIARSTIQRWRTSHQQRGEDTE